MNKYITSTFLAGLFVTASFLPSAIAAEQSLQPQGKWSVTKVDRTAQGGNSYCTLSRKYNDGVVLSLGRNQTEEYSLAIDFQKQVFEKDKSVKINLQPGPGQLRAYDMMPTSDKAIVVRLGWDAGFFDTLNQSQQMKVKIADNAYSFAMPEITKGQTELQKCMEDLKVAAKGGAGEQKTASKDVLNAEPVQSSKEFAAGKIEEKAAAMTASAPVPKAGAQQAEEKLAANFVAEDQAKGPELNNDDAPKRRNFGTKTADAASKQADQKEAAKVAKADAPAAKPEPVKTAAEEIRRPRPPVPAAEEMAAVTPAAAPSKAEIAAEKKQAAALSTAQKEIEALEAEKKALEQKIQLAEQASAKKANPDDLAKLQARAKELEIKNAQLEDTVRQSQIRIGETALNTETRSIKKIADLELKLEAAKKDNADLARQLESYRTQKEDGRLAVVAGDWDLEQATKRFNESERETRRLAQQLEQERTSCNREKAQIEQMLFDPAVADQKQIQRLSTLEDDLKSAQAKIDNQKKEIDAAVAAQVGAKTQAMETEKQALSQQVAALQKSLADKDAAVAAEKGALQKQVADLQAASAKYQTAASDAEKLNQQIADMKNALTQKDQQLAALQGDVAKSQAAAADAAKTAQQITQLQTTLTQKDQELAALKAQPKVDPAAADQRVAQEVGKVKEAADKEIIALRTQNKAMADSVETMKVALANKDKAVLEAQAAAQAAPKTDPAIMKQIADMQTNMAAIKKDNDTLRDQNIVLRQQSDKLQLQLTEAQGNGASRVDKVASMQLELDELKRQIARKDTQTVTYQNQLASLQQETAQLKQRLAVSDSGKSDSTKEVGELTRQVQQLQQQISEMDRRHASERTAMAASNVAPAAGNMAAAIAPVVTAAPVAMAAPARAQPAVAIANAGGAFDESNVKSLLQKAGLNINGVQKTSGFGGADNFGWMDSSNVKGTASVKAMGGTGFDALVSQYIAYQKTSCGGGDFASMPSPSNGSAAKQMALYEIACVKGGQGMSSSLIFFEDQGRFIAISNEIAAADMDMAMDSRDKIASLVRKL